MEADRFCVVFRRGNRRRAWLPTRITVPQEPVCSPAIRPHCFGFRSRLRGRSMPRCRGLYHPPQEVLVAGNRDIGSGVRSVTGPDSRNRRRGNAHSFRGGATTKTAQLGPNPLGRWGLPSISLSLVGPDETASFPPRFAISIGKAHRRRSRYLCCRPLAQLRASAAMMFRPIRTKSSAVSGMMAA